MKQIAKDLQMFVVTHLIMMWQKAFDESFWHVSG